MLASEWLKLANEYEERLRANQSLSPQVIEAIVQERNRIRALFSELLPEFADRISVVLTRDVHVEHCSIFSWNRHLYVLVSAALIGRPYDHPGDEDAIRAWEWIARHEVVHIREGHLPWFFHTRRLFRLTYLLGCISAIFLKVFASRQTLWIWLEPFLYLLGGLWVVQTVVGLLFEWRADLAATRSIQDPLVLRETEKSLYRMGLQARRRWMAPLSWIQYAMSVVFFDPHPPFLARRWLLRRRVNALNSP